MFDLDGTLLQFSQAEFIDAYFAELGKVFVRLGMDPAASSKAVWAGTKAMILNDGNMLNAGRFWTVFAEQMRLDARRRLEVETACDSFYANEFDAVKSVMTPNDISKRLVRAMSGKGYHVVLATNPLFPACAVETRLRWIGLEPGDFRLITHYSNSRFCKPNPRYYQEVFEKIGKAPEQCMMAGNSPVEDMSAGELGAQTFLVTDCLENEAGADITAIKRGTLAELEDYLMAMPGVGIRD